LYDPQSIEPRRVAIKTFKDVYENGHQGLAARRAWNMEAKNLRELSERNHPHLIHRIATVALGERFLILSDWANGSDLKRFWELEPKPAVSSALVLEVVKQLRGLSSAIELMHHGHHVGTLSRSVSQSSSFPTISMPGVIGVDGEAAHVAETGSAAEDSNWRHGDLKPENILRFLNADELVGTLKISDLGLAKRHVESTGLRKLPSTSKFGTPAYEPPEAMTMLLSPRSRLYDIWSFGCIMLEFVVWLLYGHEGLKEFWDLPIEQDGTRFWTRLPPGVEPGAVVNRSVTQIMEQILATNAACQSPSAIRDLLLLIKDRVLVPALPGVHSEIPPDQRRVHADVLLNALEDIENKCRSPVYCCPSQPKRDARLPTGPQPISRNMSDALRLPPTTRGNGMANLQVPSGAARAQRVIPKG
jgi:serine/threonine protein kinase